MDSPRHSLTLTSCMAGNMDFIGQMLAPYLATKIRVLDTIGPSPIPPWISGSRLPKELQGAVQHAFWDMHRDPEGRRILRSARFARFVPVSDSDYDPLRRMTAEAVVVDFPL